MSQNFDDTDKQDLIKRGFNKDDISYLESFDFDKKDLHDKIINKLDSSPELTADKLIIELKNAIQIELDKNTSQSLPTQQPVAETPVVKEVVQEPVAETPVVEEQVKVEETPQLVEETVKVEETPQLVEKTVATQEAGKKTQKNKYNYRHKKSRKSKKSRKGKKSRKSKKENKNKKSRHHK